MTTTRAIWVGVVVLLLLQECVEDFEELVGVVGSVVVDGDEDVERFGPSSSVVVEP